MKVISDGDRSSSSETELVHLKVFRFPVFSCREPEHRWPSLRRRQQLPVLRRAEEACRLPRGLPDFSSAGAAHLRPGLWQPDHLPLLQQPGHLQQPEDLPGLQQVRREPRSSRDKCSRGGRGGRGRQRLLLFWNGRLQRGAQDRSLGDRRRAPTPDPQPAQPPRGECRQARCRFHQINQILSIAFCSLTPTIQLTDGHALRKLCMPVMSSLGLTRWSYNVLFHSYFNEVLPNLRMLNYTEG